MERTRDKYYFWQFLSLNITTIAAIKIKILIFYSSTKKNRQIFWSILTVTARPDWCVLLIFWKRKEKQIYLKKCTCKLCLVKFQLTDRIVRSNLEDVVGRLGIEISHCFFVAGLFIIVKNTVRKKLFQTSSFLNKYK